ncbi:MAG: nitrite reductase [Bryobacteraceae bacterium]|nr:MAG: nitrite reductase [Bryobacteraceae bacterium]
MAWKPILGEDEPAEGAMAVVETADLRIVVCRHRGAVHAFEDRCPHAGGPLSGGNFTEGRLICPWHAWEFLCETGAWDANPAVTLQRLPVKVEQGRIWVDA